MVRLLYVHEPTTLLLVTDVTVLSFCGKCFFAYFYILALVRLSFSSQYFFMALHPVVRRTMPLGEQRRPTGSIRRPAYKTEKYMYVGKRSKFCIQSQEGKICQTPDCGKPAKLQCPTCLKLGIDGSFFCSQECFKKSWYTQARFLE
ncbi:hypothetical protein BX666DRAFT_812579 [Dichotomocladium elegans]|nr:hypothetical protein BX666DRAFT_812579 [Dichotomocladium elegans]